MYSVSENFLNKVYEDGIRHLLKVYIDGKEVAGKYILGFSRSYELFDDEFCFGGTPSAEIELKIHKDGLPATYDTIRVETGIENEVISLGTYQLEEIKKTDNYTVTIKAMDCMVRFERNYDGSDLTFPATLKAVLQDICSKIGVELGSTCFLNEDKQIAVYDNTVSARTYLSYIAESAGGFAYIGYDNKLYIKTIGSGKVEEIPFRLFQKYTWGDSFEVSRIAYEDGIQDFKVGNTTHNTVWINADNMYIVDEEQIERIYNIYEDFECYSFSGTCIINPALEVGDIVLIDGKKVVYQGKMEYKGKFKADIASDIQVKNKEDNMVRKVSDKTKIRRVQASIDQVKGEIATLVQEVDDNSEKMTEVLQTVDEISQKVENTVGFTDEVSGAISIKLTNCMAGELLELHIYGNNTVFGGLYPSGSLYPSTSLYPRKAISVIRITDKDGKTRDYDLQVETVLRQSGNFRDEFVLKDGKAYVIRRITVNDNGTVIINEKGVIEKEQDFSVLLSEGENTIRVLNYTANLYAKWMIKNDYTDVFASKVEMKSNINQTAKEITTNVTEQITQVDGKVDLLSTDFEQTASSLAVRVQQVENGVETVSGEISLKIDKTDTNQIVSMINAVANVIKLKSDYFELTADGHITATGGTIGGYTIGAHVLEGENAGMASNEYYAFWTKLHGETTYFVTWNGDISCKSIIVNGYGLVRTPTIEGQMITTAYIDGNQLVATTANGIYVFLPDSVSSDESLKKNIEDTNIKALEIIAQIEFKEFDWKGTGEHEFLGVIAQQVEKVNADLVSDVEMLDGTSSKVFNHSKMILVNAKAIQELQEENKKLREVLNDLRKRVEKLEGGKEDG